VTYFDYPFGSTQFGLQIEQNRTSIYLFNSIYEKEIIIIVEKNQKKSKLSIYFFIHLYPDILLIQKHKQKIRERFYKE
jgi:Zn-dependent peptidase ImmA (M78 family)